MSISTTSVIPISDYLSFNINKTSLTSKWLFIHKYQSVYRHANVHNIYSKSEKHDIITSILKLNQDERMTLNFHAWAFLRNTKIKWRLEI